ncbi:hypothetical protein ABIE67_009423 [Streptomyces sp. V4I8]
MSGPVRAELVGHDDPRHVLALLEQAAEEALRRLRIAGVGHEDVQDVAVLVHGAPQVVELPVDLDEDLIHVLPNLEVKRRW